MFWELVMVLVWGLYSSLSIHTLTHTPPHMHTLTRTHMHTHTSTHSHTHSNIISFIPAALTSPVIVEIVVFQNTSGAQAITNSANTPDNPVSQFTWVGPQQFSSSGGMATIQLELTEGSGLDVQVYRANEASGWVYQALDTTIANGMASAQTSSGGMFVAASSKTAIAAIATVLVVLVVLATIITVTLVVYFRVKKGAWGKFKTAVKSVPKLRRHVAGKV